MDVYLVAHQTFSQLSVNLGGQQSKSPTFFCNFNFDALDALSETSTRKVRIQTSLYILLLYFYRHVIE